MFSTQSWSMSSAICVCWMDGPTLHVDGFRSDPIGKKNQLLFSLGTEASSHWVPKHLHLIIHILAAS